jgi:hypothetical protein
VSVECQHSWSKRDRQWCGSTVGIRFVYSVVRPCPFTARPSPCSTSWGSLVRAQYRPPWKGPGNGAFRASEARPGPASGNTAGNSGARNGLDYLRGARSLAGGRRRARVRGRETGRSRPAPFRPRRVANGRVQGRRAHPIRRRRRFAGRAPQGSRLRKQQATGRR